MNAVRNAVRRVAAHSTRPASAAVVAAALAVALACRARAEHPSTPLGVPQRLGSPEAPPSKSPDPVASTRAQDQGSSRPEDAGAAARRSYVVAAIGDSLTDPKSHGGLYLRYLKEACPESRFDSYGKGGEMVNQMRRRFEADVFGAHGDARPAYTDVIVFGGVNDLYSDLTAGRTVKKIEDDLTWMYRAAKNHGARAVAITVSPWGGFSRYFNASRASTTRELNRWILSQETSGVGAAIDSTPLLSCGDPERLCPSYEPPFHDGLHFGPEGHKRLAAALLRAVFRNCR